MFEAYTQLLTEMVLRLPYQIKKIADTNSRIPPPVFDHSWFYFLSEVSEGPSRGEDMDYDCLCGPLAPQLARGISPSRAPPTTEVVLLLSVPYGDAVGAVCQNRPSTLASDSVPLTSPTRGDDGHV